ncbi:MAG: Npt1/Npt2 family nucleotide transporter [Candidatus Babeliales bacterium]
MINKLSEKFRTLWGIEKEFRLKVLFLSLTFLLMSGCLSIWRPLKVSIFAKMVGADLVPNAKIFGLFILIPLVIIYSKLVDILRRHQLLYCFTIFHGAIGLIFYYLLSHPVYGVANTQTNPARLTGWFFYFFMECFNAFLSTTFWSFADSISKPKDAKNYYGFLVCGSKIGSIITAGLLYMIFTSNTTIKESVLLPNALLVGSLLLFGAALSIYFLMKKVPGYYMHGYEAVYQLEKKIEKKKHSKKTAFIQSAKNLIDGLIIIIKNPYVFGIFSLVVFYEMIIVIFDYRVLKTASATHDTAGSLTAFYAFYYLMMNLVGLGITLFGTTPLLRVLGIRSSLFIFPVLSIILLITTFVFPTANMFIITLIILRALNYALNHPTREVLYIPTTKNIKFKAKAWTDAFGSRIAKSFGSVFNLSIKTATPMFAIITSLSFSLGLLGFWLIIVYFLGKTLQNAVDNKKVIGDGSEKTDEA